MTHACRMRFALVPPIQHTSSAAQEPEVQPVQPEVSPAVFEGDDAAAWEAMLAVMNRKPFEVAVRTGHLGDVHGVGAAYRISEAHILFLLYGKAAQEAYFLFSSALWAVWVYIAGPGKV